MKKLLFLLLVVFAFLGCSSKKSFFSISTNIPIENKKLTFLSKVLKQDNNLTLYYAKAMILSKNGGLSNSEQEIREELVDFIIKNIARETIGSGKKYFFIVSPKEVSNYRGRVINHIEDFKENINYNKSTKIQRNFIMNSRIVPKMQIEISFVMLNEKSMDYIVWNAEETYKSL